MGTVNVRLQQIFSLLLSIGGLFVAGVLSFAHSLERDLPCGVSEGCAKLAAHPSSTQFGIPVAYYGVAGYLVLALLSAFGAPAKIRALVSGFGLVASLALTYVALAVVHATCIWCLASAGIMFLIFAMNLAPAEESPKLKLAPAAIIALVGFAAAGYGAYQFTDGQRYSATKVLIDKDALAKMSLDEIAPPNAHRRGTIGGPITIVVMADLACGACGDLHRRVESLANGLKGIETIFRHRPLTMIPGHEQSGLGAVCAEIAGEKGKFYEYVDGVYGANQAPNFELYTKLLVKLGIQTEAVKRFNDSKDPATMRVQEDLKFAEKLKIISTPTIIVFGKGIKPIAANVRTFLDTMERDDIAKVLAEVNPM